ncbi:hypothetical protein B0H10DRAFT_2213090 [Mycena sp. CBHHK59/15]|nr:hypothetical protein B0H10DRAFT_2213090 [Mycena sp. CBHHK59/15]
MTMTFLLYISLLISAVHSYTPSPRWGQATSLITSSLFIQGGKQDPFNSLGYDTALAANDLLFLPLASSFPIESPPWELISTSANASNPQGPPVAWHTLSAYNSSMLLLFGGMPSPSVPIATMADSGWLLNVFNRLVPEFTQEPLGWADEPMRRIHHAAVSAITGEVYIFGGEKADNSLIAFSDNYVYNSETSGFALLPTDNAPPALTGHAAVILPNGQIYIFGGFDGWIYNITTATWTSVPALSALGERKDHFATSYGGQVIFGFGYGSSAPANATLQVFDPTSTTFQLSFTPPPPTATVTPTIPVASATDTGIASTHTGSGTTLTGSGVHPTSTHDSQPTSGGGNGDNPGTGRKATQATAIAVGTVLGVLAFIGMGLVAVWYIRRQQRHHWAEGGVGGVFSPLANNEGGAFHRSAPSAAVMFNDAAPAEKSVVGSAVSTVSATLGSWGLWIAGALGLGVVGAGAMATERDRKQRRDMLVDEDTRDFGAYGWYDDGDTQSSRRERFKRNGSGDSAWSLMSVFRPRPRRENSAASGMSFGSRLGAGSLLGHSATSSEKDPFRDVPPSGVFGATRPRGGQRQASYDSVASNYVDPFADPISQQDIAGPGALLLGSHNFPRAPLSPVAEMSRISSSGASASQSGSSNDHQALSPFDSLSRSSLGVSSSSHQHPPAASPFSASPSVSPALSSLSGRPQPRTTSIIGMNPHPPPDQPIRRSDTWWARFANKSLLDRRSSRGSASAAGVLDIRDPNPPPQRLGFVKEETSSVLRERSDGSDQSRVQRAGTVYGAKGHGKSMSSLQTQRTADSAAIERMGGNVDVVLRGHRQSGSTSTRASLTDPGVEEIYTSPVEMVPASSFASPPRLRSPSPPPTPTASRPPLSTASSGSSGVALRVREYERRTSQDVTPPPPTNTRQREERTRKQPHSNYGLATRPSLFVANPDHRAGDGSGDS